MEKVLVLRLLIYGIVSQVADKQHACGNTGTATSFRRPDGITIVCLPLPSPDDVSGDKSTLLSQGITLRVTPNHLVGPHPPTSPKMKLENSFPPRTTTRPPIEKKESSPSPPSRRPESKSNNDTVEEEEEEEEDE